MRRAASLAATVMIAVALLCLAGATAAAVIAMDRTNTRVGEARAVVNEFTVLQQSVADEAFAEAGYRRAPGAEAWNRLETAIAATTALIRHPRSGISRTDNVTLSTLGVINARYVADVRATLKLPSYSADDRVAGPALDSMNSLLESTIRYHRDAVTQATDRQAQVIRNLRFILPAVFTIAFSILLWTFRLSAREQQRLRRESAASKAQALTDALTGLPNRAALLGTMGDVLSRPGPSSALLFLDLDRFKPINDTYGHHAGDSILQQVAHRLMDVVRADDLAARLGGDEFAIFLRRSGDAERVANHILRAFEDPFDVDGCPVSLGTSIGIAESETTGRDSESMLRAADKALYRAKGAGRRRAVLNQAS